MKTEVKCLTGFRHNGNRIKDSKFFVSEPIAKQLSEKGLVEVVTAEKPQAKKEKPADKKAKGKK